MANLSRHSEKVRKRKEIQVLIKRAEELSPYIIARGVAVFVSATAPRSKDVEINDIWIKL